MQFVVRLVRSGDLSICDNRIDMNGELATCV
jgi:hypothetical protein